MKLFLRAVNYLRRPWDRDRRLAWLGFLLIPFFGRKFRCQKCHTPLGRALFLPWKNSILFLHKGERRVRFAPAGFYELAAECVDNILCANKLEFEKIRENNRYLVTSINNDPKKNAKFCHLIIGHQKNEYLAQYIDHHQKIASQNTDIILIYGGQYSDFLEIEYSKKIFCDDPALRGPAKIQSYSKAWKMGYEYSLQFGEYDFYYITESDHWALQGDYLVKLRSALLDSCADFIATLIVRADDTNEGYVEYAKQAGIFQKLAKVALCPQGIRLFHSIGTNYFMRSKCLKDFCCFDHDDSGVFLEVWIPSFLVNRGFTYLEGRMVPGLVDCVRYRPFWTPDEIVSARSGGAVFIHPVKDATLVCTP